MLYSCTHMATVGIKGLKQTEFVVFYSRVYVMMDLVWCTGRDEHCITDKLDYCVSDDAVVVKETLP